MIQGGSGCKNHRTEDSIVEGHLAGRHSDWIIRGRPRRSGHNPRARRNMACRTGQGGRGRIKQKGPTPPGLQRPG